jgi:presenilin-like A22 family membrane protease
MKHSIKITSIIVLIFILSQVFGLFIVDNYMSTDDNGNTVYKELPLNIERPEMKENVVWIYILSAILIGTIIMLGLIKLQAKLATKIWFFLAIFMALTISLSSILSNSIAITIALLISLSRLIKPNFIINNLSEIFLYGGITAIFHNVLNIKISIIILLLISLYDYIAVYKIKHMITLAKYQTSEKLFAGIMIPYKIFNNNKFKMGKLKNIINLNFLKNIKQRKKPNSNKRNVQIYSATNNNPKNSNEKTAILGGGDMAFPLFFSASIMKEYNIIIALIPVITSTLSLIYLFLISKKNKFYPAMPFLTIGCLLGYGIIFLI